MYKTDYVRVPVSKECVLQAINFAIAQNKANGNEDFDVYGVESDSGNETSLVSSINDGSINLESMSSFFAIMPTCHEAVILDGNDESGIITTKFEIGDVVYGIIPVQFSVNNFAIKKLKIVRIAASESVCGMNMVDDMQWFEEGKIRSRESKRVSSSKRDKKVVYYCYVYTGNEVYNDTLYRLNENELSLTKEGLLNAYNID